MSRPAASHPISERGFSLVEVLVAMTVTLIVMSSVFGLLTRSQRSFRREPEIADLHQNTRSGLDLISRDLTMAGYHTPPTIAIRWLDGGGTTPDELTIVYGDALLPTVEALPCASQGGGACKNVGQSSVLWVDKDSFNPPQANPEEAYEDGTVLLAIESSDCNWDGEIGVTLFELTKDPEVSDGKLMLQHNPGGSTINLPGGFNEDVSPDCTVFGQFKVIQYRVSPLPPAPNPALERRDVGLGEPWTSLAANIEDFQVQYGIGTSTNWVDAPPQMPDPNDPTTWIMRVGVTLRGRTESTDLQGGTTSGALSPEDTHVRKSFSTTVSLRNVAGAAEEFEFTSP